METPTNPQEAFMELLIAAMCDAAVEKKLTQLQTTITPPGRKHAKIVRIIVIPEDMTYNFPLHAPLGTPDKTKEN